MFKKDFEKKFFSENTNIQFCKTLLENGLKDPISGEFGKTIVFCVSQSHCAKIVQILNKMAHDIWQGKYNSDFAMQVTSRHSQRQYRLSGEKMKQRFLFHWVKCYRTGGIICQGNNFSIFVTT